MKPLSLMICLAAAPGIAFSATPAAQLAASCAACHLSGADGAGIPPIAGHDEKRIEQTMLAYRSDAHGSQIMHVVAAALSPAEIATIAHYLAGTQ